MKGGGVPSAQAAGREAVDLPDLKSRGDGCAPGRWAGGPGIGGPRAAGFAGSSDWFAGEELVSVLDVKRLTFGSGRVLDSG